MVEGVVGRAGELVIPEVIAEDPSGPDWDEKP